MRKIVHLSDLHFGTIHLPTLEPLIAQVHEVGPHVIAISGDLTQRARQTQFREAAAFLKKLPAPQIVVPGNHDIPLYNLFSRFFQPLTDYRRFISDELFPFYLDEEIAVIGVNTARSLTTKNGRINVEQVARIREKMCDLDGAVKIVVTHHPFDLPETVAQRHLVGRSAMALERLAECRVDVFLAGHLHVTRYGRTIERYKANGFSSLFVQAGTATSTRERSEANSFNVLEVERNRVQIERMTWEPDRNRFKRILGKKFLKTPEGWREDDTDEGSLNGMPF